MLRLTLLTTVLIAAGSSAFAATVLPYTETFSTGNSSWFQNAGANPANWLSSGGVGGGGYITTTFGVTTASSGTPVIARATGSAGSSGGAFQGDYSGITQVSFSVKTDATFAVPIALRLGGTVGGTAILIDGGLLQPGSDWTQFTFDINPSNSKILSYEGTPGATGAEQFANVVTAISNLQVFLYLAEPGYVPPASTTNVTFSVDNVAVVPEPATGMLFGLAVPALLMMRRRRCTATAMAMANA